MNNQFSKFETFGIITDSAKRKKIAEMIYAQITNKTEKGIGFVNSNSDNFADAIEIILENETMKELCSQDKGLAEKITQDILDFINKTKKQINKTENSFEKEDELLSAFLKIPKTEFIKYFEEIKHFLKKNYKFN